jgi:asparagine synthetase B (glutamine-hydrolysing)
VHRFVVVGSRGTPAIDERTAGLLSNPSPPGLPFDPQDHVHWRSADGLVHVASWSADELVQPTARTVEGGIVALGGLPVVTRPSGTATLLRPEDVATRLTSLEGLTERLDGPYALVAIGADGAGTAVNDPFGLHPLYLGELGSVAVIGNDAALVAAVLESSSGRPPEPDADAVAWLLLNGQMFGDDTPYRGVRRLCFGDAARFDRDRGLTVVPWHEPPWSRFGTSWRTPQPTIDEAEQRMIATIGAAVSAMPECVAGELTAGKDSRLVLALAARAGLVDRIRFCTYGPVSSPDGLVASEIAHRLGLRHERGSWPARPGGPTLENFIAHVRQVSAQIPCWEMSAPRAQPGIVLSGLTGESLRTNYPKMAGLTSAEDAEAAFARYRFGRYHYVRDDVLHDLQQRSRRLFRAPLDSGAAPEDLFDIFYVKHRLRRWIGDKPDRFAGYVFPLYSPAAVRLAMAEGWERRAQGAFHEEVARRAQLSIDDISFEQGTRWRDAGRAAEAPAQERDGRGPAPRPAFTRDDVIAVRKRTIHEAIASDPANPAFELVDRDAMVADTDDYASLDRRRQIELHQALTVVLWLGLARPDRATVTK